MEWMRANPVTWRGCALLGASNCRSTTKKNTPWEEAFVFIRGNGYLHCRGRGQQHLQILQCTAQKQLFSLFRHCVHELGADEYRRGVEPKEGGGIGG